MLTGALKEFDGAILAITHNQAFANTLNATHILRVADGVAKLEDNKGLSAKDFEHTPRAPPPPAPAAPAAKAAAAVAAPAAASSSKSGKQSEEPVAAEATAAAPAAAASAPVPAAAKAKAKRTILAYAEKIEYEVCCMGHEH